MSLTPVSSGVRRGCRGSGHALDRPGHCPCHRPGHRV